MLYRTHHPFFSQFHTFTSSILPSATTATTSLIFSHNPSIQAETEMECGEAALKTSLRKEMAGKSTPQVLFEDMWPVNGQNGVGCDDLFVDELLDLSNEDGFVNEEPVEGEDEEEEDKGFASVSPQQDNQNSLATITFSAKDEFGSELSVPADDLANLEWLSHFVEDSFSEFSTLYPPGILAEKPRNQGPEPEPDLAKPCFKTPVPAKARSKRTRTGGRVWSFKSPSLTESSSSSTSSTSSSSPSSPWLICANTAHNAEPVEPVNLDSKLLVKKQKKRPAAEGASGSGGAQPPRRCSHCGVQKTPQWRTGPLGAKTLCNACGVRFKSGRLLPEYRPACSPTFSSELHSNHHRKVLEMRRKKDTDSTESGLAHPVSSSF
ncbi:GATA transcription factor 5 [Morella rubra]|uniref:GATA transcription factor 5 n=1 Tax=Morella rubra TaxID=262757 RepID=A0A6A1VUP9_9ROSI|nr:GATA transcription factor 5 [Morella rubra]KAB1216678.1 GATA transcription factor 5 [Morella rubra]KAB1216682.1 GATA transcription factor 5 [Morella rubra]